MVELDLRARQPTAMLRSAAVSADEPEDHELLQRWRDGDPRGGEALVQRYFRGVFRFFSGKVPDHADDLTQATFLACSEARDRIDHRRKFRPYLYGIARNMLLRHLERRYAEGRRFEPHQTSLHDVGLANKGPVTAREDQRLLVAALNRLPVDIQITLELHYFWSMPLNDIASATEVPVGTVKSRLHRGRALLRAAIEALELPPALTVDTLEQMARFVSGRPDSGASDPD